MLENYLLCFPAHVHKCTSRVQRPVRIPVAALALVQPGQVVERVSHVGMFGSQRFLADGKAALLERLDLPVAAYRPEQQRSSD